MKIDHAMQLDQYRNCLQRVEQALAEVQSVVQGALMFDGPARAQLWEAHECLLSAVLKMRREVHEVETAARQRMTNAPVVGREHSERTHQQEVRK